MLSEMKSLHGKALTVRGPVDPASLGRMLMHEHLHADLYDWERDDIVRREAPVASERMTYLMDNAVPLLRECAAHGMRGYCDVTPMPWRGWPDIYTNVSEASGVHIVLCTGFYREIELGSYFARTPDRQIWSFIREATEDELAELCIREIVDGLHGTKVRAGAIKLGTSRPAMTPTETKAFRAGALAQRSTGVHITTHCTWFGSETSQLTVLDAAGVDLSRVVVGHTHGHLMDKAHRRTVLDWMRRGANFMPTNLDVTDPARWQPLVEAIHEIFDAGLGAQLCFGIDHGYCSESGPLAPQRFLPPPPFLYMFTDVLPAFRELGLTADEERAIMETNPQRIVAVR